jgi:hypothetical protein
MPKGVYDRNPKEIPNMASEPLPRQTVPRPADQELRAAGEYEIVGYLKEAVKRKDAAGNWRSSSPKSSSRAR